jgi:hypothetical protein
MPLLRADTQAELPGAAPMSPALASRQLAARARRRIRGLDPWRRNIALMESVGLMPPGPMQRAAIAKAKRTDSAENSAWDSGGPAVVELVAL